MSGTEKNRHVHVEREQGESLLVSAEYLDCFLPRAFLSRPIFLCTTHSFMFIVCVTQLEYKFHDVRDIFAHFVFSPIA